MTGYRAPSVVPVIAAALLFFVGPAAGYGDGAPSGHSGAFGEPDCSACHAAGNLTRQPADVALKGLPERIMPGETYVLELAVSSDEIQRVGFQLAVRDSEGTPAGRLLALDDRSRVEREGPEVLVHTEPGSRPRDRSSALWKFEWTAPLNGPDEIFFAVAINEANDDDSAFGDLVSSHLFRRPFGP